MSVTPATAATQIFESIISLATVAVALPWSCVHTSEAKGRVRIRCDLIKVSDARSLELEALPAAGLTLKNAGDQALLKSMADAWTRKDHASVLKAFAENVHDSDPTRYSFKTLGELKCFFDSSEVSEQVCTIHATVFDEDQQLGVGEYTYIGEHRYHGLVLVKLANDKISLWREYQHISEHDWEKYIQGPMARG